MNSLIRNGPPDGMHRLTLPLSVKESSFLFRFLVSVLDLEHSGQEYHGVPSFQYTFPKTKL